MVHLIHYSTDFVSACIDHQSFFSFTKRSFDQVISQGSELMKRHQWSISDLHNALNYHDLLTSKQSPQQRLHALLNIMKQLVHPTLITHNLHK